MIVTFRRGAAPSKNQETTACPLSWTATTLLSYSESSFTFSTPPRIFYVANSKSIVLTSFLSFLAARIAASLQILEMSAPLNPGVKVASLFAYSLIDFSAESLSG
jgi:hypothetical protein